VTLLARAGQDALAAALGQALQDAGATWMGATPHPVPTSVQARTPLLPGETALALVGAHMSGLPLNPRITRLGGRFLEATSTAPDYRLFALAGGPPARPGLLRVGQEGASIALELWALSPQALGELLVEIPSPLGLGQISLADGRSVVGFLAEAAGLDDARDITAFGGWRPYLSETSP
jgi:allophanate hydrolase